MKTELRKKCGYYMHVNSTDCTLCLFLPLSTLVDGFARGLNRKQPCAVEESCLQVISYLIITLETDVVLDRAMIAAGEYLNWH